MATHTQTHDNVEMLCLPVYSDVTFLFFFFRSCRGAKSHDCNKAKEYQMQWNFFCMLAEPLWFGPELLFFFFFSALRGHLIVCKYYSLFEKESAPILIKLYT